MRRVVDSGAIIVDVLGCLFPNSAFSTDGVYFAPYFVTPVHELHVWQLLRLPIVVCSFLDNFDSSLRSSFYLFMPKTR